MRNGCKRRRATRLPPVNNYPLSEGAMLTVIIIGLSASSIMLLAGIIQDRSE